MSSLALRGVCFTAKCCFCYLLAQRQEEAGANSSEGWEEEICKHQHEDRAEPASQQVVGEQHTEEV